METTEESLSKLVCTMDRTAQEKFESFLRDKNTEYMEGYDAGKSDQRKIDIENARWFLMDNCMGTTFTSYDLERLIKAIGG